jgi:YesN/AraC family two-component response regulator
MMPGIDGFEVVNKIRVNECSSHIPIIMLTAKNDFDSRMDGWKNNVDEYLGKPFQFEELQLRINNLISIRHILKKRFGNELSTQSPIANFKSENIYDKDKEFIRKFENIVSDSYIKAEFSRTHAASLMAISERQLNRKLAALVDHNFSEYLRKYRLRKAISLFNHGLQVAQIGDQVGFSSTSYFTTCFKAEYGKTVKQYESDSLTKTTELE